MPVRGRTKTEPIILRNDFRFAFRALARTPGFTLLATASLALGIAASAAVFSLVSAVYFRPLPFRTGGEVALIELFDQRKVCRGPCRARLTRREVADLAGTLRATDALAALAVYPAVVSDYTGIAIGAGAAVSPNFLSILGIRPIVGRAFDSADVRPGAENVGVLSHAFWSERYGGDSSVIGRALTLNGTLFQIIGVLPPTAAIGPPLFSSDTTTAQFFIPLGPYTERTPGSTYSFTLLASLRAGMRIENLRTDLELLLSRPRGDSNAVTGTPSEDAPANALVLPLRDAHVSSVTPSPYLMFLGAVAFVLLVTCANLAGLFLARFQRRRHDMLVRTALGATPWKLARLASLEGLLCAVVGGAGGVALAAWVVGLARFLPPRGIPYWTDFTVDARVLAFAAGLVGICAALVGVVPALLVLRRGTSLSLREMSTGLVGGPRVAVRRLVLVALEIQLALVLLTGAGLLGKTFLDAAGRDLGMSKRSVLTAALAGRGTESMSPSDQRFLAERALARLQALPGVIFAAVRTVGPEYAGLTREGDAQPIPVTPPLRSEAVTSDYFQAWSIPVLEGRAINKTDGADGLPVVIVDERTAQRIFPGGRALGRRIALGEPSSASNWMTIVGIVGTTRGLFPEATDRFYPALYQPFSQVPPSTSGLRFAVRTVGPSSTMIPSIRAAFREVSPNTPLLTLTSMEDHITQQLAPLRLNATVISGLAVTALIIAALGVYGVVTQLVSQRSAEVGLRLALGARPASVVRLMMSSAIAATLVGLAGGLAGAFVLTRLIRSLLYGTSATDPRVFIWAILVLVATAVVAAYVPARRASRAEPALILRNL